MDQERPGVRGTRRGRSARPSATRSSRRWSRSSASASPRAAPTSSTTPTTPRSTVSTPRSGSDRSPPATSTCAPPGSSRVILIVLGVRDHRADQRRQADRGGRRLRAGHRVVHDLAQARAGDRPRRRRSRVRVPGDRRRRRHRRAAVGLVPHRGRRRVAVHRHRQASRGAGRARLRFAQHRSTLGEYSTSFLGFVRAVVVGGDDHRVLPLGVRERRAHRRRHAGSASRSSRS